MNIKKSAWIAPMAVALALVSSSTFVQGRSAVAAKDGPTAITQIGIEAFDSTSGWHVNAYEGDGDTPEVYTSSGATSGNSVLFSAVPGSATEGFSSFASKEIGPLDLSDCDYLMHFWAKAYSLEGELGAFIIYLVSGDFDPDVHPYPGNEVNGDFFQLNIQTLTPTIWKEFGTYTNPVWRSSFYAWEDADWTNITGIVISFEMQTPDYGGFVLDDFYAHMSDFALPSVAAAAKQSVSRRSTPPVQSSKLGAADRTLPKTARNRRKRAAEGCGSQV